MTKRKFYKSTVVVEILSEYKPTPWYCLEDIEEDINAGSCVDIKSYTHEKVTPEEILKLLKKSCADASHLNLTPEGDDLVKVDYDTYVDGEEENYSTEE